MKYKEIKRITIKIYKRPKLFNNSGLFTIIVKKILRNLTFTIDIKNKEGTFLT